MNSRELKGTIRQAHPKLFRGQKTLFTHELLGNHDNNDDDCFKQWKGFCWTRKNVILIMFGSSGDKQRALADYVADQLDQEMRLYLLHRADRILMEHPGTSLVIMGHTHSACLLQDRRGSPLLLRHPHAAKYLASDACVGPRPRM